MFCTGVFSSNKHQQSVQDDDPAVMYKKRTYSLSNDSVNAVLKVIQYSKAIIQYDITIITSKNKIEQKGYALNLGSEMNGGFEYESDENGKELRVIPYNSYLCSCGDQEDFEIRISLDKKRLVFMLHENFDMICSTIKLTKVKNWRTQFSCSVTCI